METEKVVNDTQAAVVEPKPSDAAVTGASTEAKAPAAAPAKPQQSEQDNAKFAEWRRKTEQLERELAEERAAKSAYSKLADAVKEHLGYQGSNPEEIRLAILAQQQGKSVAEIREQESLEVKRAQELLESNPEVIELRRFKAEQIAKAQAESLARDLAEIKAKYPNETAADIKELGETFAKLRAAGVDNLTAYRAIKPDSTVSVTPKTEEPPLPETGAVNGAAATEEKEYYTPQEVDKLTKKDLSNPTVWERVRASMTKWGKQT
jgi:hypothetical protein